MRVTVYDRKMATSDVEFEVPGLSRRPSGMAFNVSKHPTSDAVAMHLLPGLSAVWSATTGRLLWRPDPPATALAWAPDGQTVYALAGKEYVLRAYDWPGGAVRWGRRFTTRNGWASHLSISSGGGRCVVISYQQHDWDYEVWDLDPWGRTAGVRGYILA